MMTRDDIAKLSAAELDALSEPEFDDFLLRDDFRLLQMAIGVGTVPTAFQALTFSGLEISRSRKPFSSSMLLIGFLVDNTFRVEPPQ